MYTIYRIINELDKRSYVGYTVQTARERFVRHKHSAKNGSQTHLHRAMRVYGVENFSFDVLCWGDDKESGLRFAEPLMIDIFKPEYNMTKGGDGSLGRVVSHETREKLRKNATGYKRSTESRANQSMRTRGIPRGPHSEERKINISLAKKRQNRTATLETRKKLSDSRRGRKFSLEIIEKLRLGAAKRRRKNGKFI